MTVTRDSWSSGSKLLKVVYMLWWYAGPMNRVPYLDFSEVSMHAQRLLLVSLLLLVMAGCAAQPSALHTTTPQLRVTQIPTLVPASTSTSVPLPADVTRPPFSGVGDYTAGWKIFTSSKGYQLKYPPQLLLEERTDNTYVLLQDKNPLSYVFSMDERDLVTLAEMRDKATANFINPTFTEINKPGARGFVVEGRLGPGYGQGEYAKSAYIELDSHVVAFGCSLRLCTSRFFDQILATLETIP